MAGIQVDGEREISLDGCTITHHSGKYHYGNKSYTSYKDLLENIKADGIHPEKRARTIYFKKGKLFTKKAADISLEAEIVNTPSGWSIVSNMPEFTGVPYFKTEADAIRHLTEKHPMFKIVNATIDEINNLVKTRSATFQCDMLNVSGISYQQIKGSQAEDVKAPPVTESSAIGKTINLAKDSVSDGLKMAGARQGSRAIASLMENIAETLLDKTGNSQFKPFLKTDLGKMIMEIGSPIILHAALQQGLIGRSAYVEKLEVVTKWAIDANVKLYTMKYSDTAGDFVKNLFTDAKTRDNLKSIFALGTAFVSAESGDTETLNKFMLPMANPLESLIEEVTEKDVEYAKK